MALAVCVCFVGSCANEYVLEISLALPYSCLSLSVYTLCAIASIMHVLKFAKVLSQW